MKSLDEASRIKKHPIVVIKLGTSSIVDENTHQPLLSNLALIVETATTLRRSGCKVVLVSSGAIGYALHALGLPRRPKHLPQVQALAAIGQCRLMGLWDQLFDRIGQIVAQVLITRNDIADRTHYLNAQNTFQELLNMGVIPIVNENDTLSVAEIKFGDNDTLSAITAGMIGADYLFLMTDVDCLYDKNPRKHPDAKPIECVENIAELEVDVSSKGSSLGTGGMETKIVAARLATAAGVTTVITRSSKPGAVAEIVEYIEGLKHQTAIARPSSQPDSQQNTRLPPTSSSTNTNTDNPSLDPYPSTSTTPLAAPPPPPTTSSTTSITNPNTSPPSPQKQTPLHTRFLPSTTPIRDRHFWLLHGLTPHGTIYIDSGAASALASHAGLLPVGVVSVDGAFAQQECVSLVQVARRGQGSGCVSPGQVGQEIGRAIVTYSSSEIKRIAGLRSSDIASVLGYADSEYVAHRENVAMFEWGSGSNTNSRPATPTIAFVTGAEAGAGTGGGGGNGNAMHSGIGALSGLGSGGRGAGAAESLASLEEVEGVRSVVARRTGLKMAMGLGGYVEG